jgi:hypothetical protein
MTEFGIGAILDHPPPHRHWLWRGSPRANSAHIHSGIHSPPRPLSGYACMVATLQGGAPVTMKMGRGNDQCACDATIPPLRCGFGTNHRHHGSTKMGYCDGATQDAFMGIFWFSYGTVNHFPYYKRNREGLLRTTNLGSDPSMAVRTLMRRRRERTRAAVHRLIYPLIAHHVHSSLLRSFKVATSFIMVNGYNHKK